MRAAAILAVVALAMVCFGQEPPARPPAAKRMDLTAVPKIESAIEQQVQGLDPVDRFDLMGACSGIYLSGYGLVFTTPVSLVAPPEFGPFTGSYTPQKAESVHQRKLAHLPVLEKAMRAMLTSVARSFTALPPDEKLVVAVRLFYMDWEDKTGLPNQIVMSASRASALAGDFQTEEQ